MVVVNGCSTYRIETDSRKQNNSREYRKLTFPVPVPIYSQQISSFPVPFLLDVSPMQKQGKTSRTQFATMCTSDSLCTFKKRLQQ